MRGHHSYTIHRSPAPLVFYISLVFTNARRLFSQCNTRLRRLYLLNKITILTSIHPKAQASISLGTHCAPFLPLWVSLKPDSVHYDRSTSKSITVLRMPTTTQTQAHGSKDTQNTGISKSTSRTKGFLLFVLVLMLL